MIKNILKTLRINHYIKNAIVVIPLLFSMNYANISLIAKCICIFISFSFISSSVYIFNDLIDIQNDRNHPIKSKRPIASGEISKFGAFLLIILLITLSVITSVSINNFCLLMIILYFLLNILYSMLLKNVIIVDALCISVGFILRIVAGCFAISVKPSPFIILMTFFISLFFTFSKRRMEMKILGIQSCRKSIKALNLQTIDQFIITCAILAIAFYSTYTIDEKTIIHSGNEYMYVTTIPFVIIILRLISLINSQVQKDDPIIFLNDKILQYSILSYFVVLFITYFIP